MSKLEEIKREFAEIEGRLSAAVPPPPGERQQLAKRHAALLPLVGLIREKERIDREIADAKALESDPEMRPLAVDDLARLAGERARVEKDLKSALIPRDPRDNRNVFLELRAGAGLRHQIAATPGVARLQHGETVPARQDLRGDATQEMRVAVVPVRHQRVAEHHEAHAGASFPASAAS